MEILLGNGGSFTSKAEFTNRTTFSAATQVATANTPLTVTLNFERHDPDGIASVGSSQVTLTNSGQHTLMGSVLIQTAANGDECALTIHDVTAGLTVGETKFLAAIQTFSIPVIVTAEVNPVSANNVYELRVISSSNANVGKIVPAGSTITLATSNLDHRAWFFVGRK